MYDDISPSNADGLPEEKPWNDASGAVPRFQRGRGRAALVFSQRSGRTVAARTFQGGTMKLHFPNVAAGNPPEAVLVNLGGGLTGGDRVEISASVERQASAVMTTQACEKIYRSLGDDAVIETRLAVDDESELDWLGQPCIMFDGGRLRRETHVDLAPGSRFLGLEAVIFGRTAMGETVREGALSDAWFIRRGGELIHAERFLVSGDVDETLSRPAVIGPNKAMATLRYVAEDASERLEEMRTILAEGPGNSAASAWNGMLLARIVAPGGYELNKELLRVLAAFRRVAPPRAWIL